MTTTGTGRGTGAGRDRGSSSLEFAGMLPLLLLVAVAAVQLGIVGYAVQQAGTGARAAARTAGRSDIADDYAATGKAAMSQWTASRSEFTLGGGEHEATVTATVTIPSIVPGIDDFGGASRSATMPVDQRLGGDARTSGATASTFGPDSAIPTPHFHPAHRKGARP